MFQVRHRQREQGTRSKHRAWVNIRAGTARTAGHPNNKPFEGRLSSRRQHAWHAWNSATELISAKGTSVRVSLRLLCVGYCRRWTSVDGLDGGLAADGLLVLMNDATNRGGGRQSGVHR